MATKKKADGTLDKRGARSKYNDDFPLLAQGYARRGYSDKQIAEALNISVNSFYVYVKKYPEFSKAIADGKQPVDTMVENAMLKSALGYDYDEKKTRKFVDNNGKTVVEETITSKHVQGSFPAQSFWLTNRMREYWKKEQPIDKSLNMDDVEEKMKMFMQALFNNNPVDK